MSILKQNVTDTQLISAIKRAVNELKPLSIVRCGDGEMHFLKTYTDFDDRDMKVHHHAMCLNLHRDRVWRCNVHSPIDTVGPKPLACDCYLKDPMYKRWISHARQIVSDAIRNADYIGLEVPGLNPRYYTIDSAVLQKYNINHNNLKVISSLFPRERAFGSIDSFRDLIQGNDIHIVTANVDRFRQSNINEKLGVNVTYTDISGMPSYKTNIRELVKSSVGKTSEKIILFGGGYGIKDLIPWSSKEHGKIAIDVGSVLDAWSGYKSRIMYEKPEFQHLIWTETQSI